MHSVFGSFGLSTKEPYTIMLCASSSLALASSPLATGLDIEASYLVCTYALIYAHKIFNDCDLFLNGRLSLIWYIAHTDYHRDFLLHILMYLFFTFIHKRNNATVTFLADLKEMGLVLKCTFRAKRSMKN